VLLGLLRELIFKSTKLLQSHSFAELQQFDISVHKRLSLNQLCAFNSVYVVTRGQFSCPAKSFFIFAHNQDLSPAFLTNHPLVRALKDVKNLSDLRAAAGNLLHIEEGLPRSIDINPRPAYDLAEFDQSFYHQKYQQGCSPHELFKLRLCAFIDMKKSDRLTIEFKQSYAARYVSVMFTDRVLESDHDVNMAPNYDVQTIYFSGNMVPSLFHTQMI